VTNLENQRSIIVKLNDRGPFHEGRLIDLSYSAANQLGIVAEGTGPVEVEAIDPIAWAATNSQQTHQYPVLVQPNRWQLKPVYLHPKTYQLLLFYLSERYPRVKNQP